MGVSRVDHAGYIFPNATVLQRHLDSRTGVNNVQNFNFGKRHAGDTGEGVALHSGPGGAVTRRRGRRSRRIMSGPLLHGAPFERRQAGILADVVVYNRRPASAVERER